MEQQNKNRRRESASADDMFSEAVALHHAGKLNNALLLYNQTIAASPSYAKAYNNRGIIYLELKQYNEALANFDKAIALNPDYADAHSNRGLVLYSLKQYAAAAPSYDKAIALNPNHTLAYNNRGLLRFRLGQYGVTAADCGRAIALNPTYAEAYNTRGIALHRMKHYDEALADFEKAIALSPSYAEPHWNKGNLKLLLGEYEEGWKLYEWRWKKKDVDAIARTFRQPLWLGKESLAGKTIFLHSEQGLGDTLQFCRYAPLVEKLGARVILEAQKSLIPLLATLEGTCAIIPLGTTPDAFDFHCPIMSLPLAFKTTVDTIPAATPYLFTDPQNLKAWQERLGAKSKPRIGLCWSGAATNGNDKNRSMPLSTLAPLMECDVEYHAIQNEVRPQDAEFLAKSGIHFHEPDLHNFLDTASLASEMDVIIAVDTSIAHLAGALGGKLWVLLPCVPSDFRWMETRQDSPWYPSARLFRQTRIGDWNGVIARVKAELEQL